MLETAKAWLLRTPFGEPARWLAHRLWPLTALERNERYDAETLAVIVRVLSAGGHAVDVGAHAGSVLREIVRVAPAGPHWAFEPLPAFAARVRAQFPTVTVHEVALAEAPGTATFQHVVSEPAYSGLQRRDYPQAETIEPIIVRTARLDDLLPDDVPISFVKIDVEGGEFGVLRGAVRTLRRWRPIVVFEHGPGAAEYYGTTSEAVAALLEDCGLAVTLMRRWLRGWRPFTAAEFVACVQKRREFYYLAGPASGARAAEHGPQTGDGI